MPEIWDFYRTPPSDRRVDFIDSRWVAARPEIDFIGVWDTVGALGIPGNVLGRIGRRRHEFHDVKLGKKIRRGYQALAIDEHRKLYPPAVWDTKMAAAGQTIEQVWFAGAHSNVGGGYPDPVLSDQAFLWMVSKAAPLLTFDEDFLERRVEKLAEDEARGRLVDPIRGFWRMFGRHYRVIGTDKSESIHWSASARYSNRDKDPPTYEPHPYEPKNLVEYLGKQQGHG
jgi:hypothetical protein